MKLVRFGAAGQEKPGILDSAGRIRDVSSVVPDFTGSTLSPAGIARLRGLALDTLPLAPAGARLGAPVARPGNFIAVGLNYADHAKETGQKIPAEPILFNKATNCMVGPNDDVMLPKTALKVDWEVELALVIGTRADNVSEQDALSHVAGYAVCNDVSERHFQSERGGQWMKGKGCATFGPLGPWLVTPDEIKDVQALPLWLDVNGERMQAGSTGTMIFPVAFLISYISQFLVLDPGDVITTGTPPGVGMARTPPHFLKEGDEVRLGVEGLGEQRQRIVPYQA